MNNLILTPSFSDWFLDLISSWINLFDEKADDEDRGDAHEENDEEKEDASSAKDQKDDEEDPKDDEEETEKELAAKKKAEDEADDDKSEHMIPKSRYDSAATRARTAEERNAELETENASLRTTTKDPATPDIDTQLTDLDRKIEEARADNNIDQVVALGKEQRALEREFNQEVATSTSTAAGKAAREQIQLDAVVDDLEATHDFLNEDHEDFDQAVIGEILDIQQGLVLTGKYSPAQAMRKASKLVIIETPAGEKPDPKVTNIKKNLETAKKIPPDNKDKGENSDKAGDIEDASAVSEMTMEEFDAIPESTIKRLRGDAI